MTLVPILFCPSQAPIQDLYALSETDILAIKLGDNIRVRTPLSSVISVNLAPRPKVHQRRYRIDLR